MIRVHITRAGRTLCTGGIPTVPGIPFRDVVQANESPQPPAWCKRCETIWEQDHEDRARRLHREGFRRR